MTETKEDHILVCISPASNATHLIRESSRMASAYNAKLTALYVKPRDYDKLSDKDKELLQSYKTMASEAGANTVVIEGNDIVYQISAYAKMADVTKIIIGSHKRGRYEFPRRMTHEEELAHLCPFLDIIVVQDSFYHKQYHTVKKRQFIADHLLEFAVTALIFALTTGICSILRSYHFNEAIFIVVYILGVLLTALFTKGQFSGFVYSIAAILVFNYYFADPEFGNIRLGEEWVVTEIFAFLVVFITGMLASRLHYNANRSEMMAYRTQLLLDTNLLLEMAKDRNEILETAEKQLGKLLNTSVHYRPAKEEEAGVTYYPIQVENRSWGYMAIENSGKEMDFFEESLLHSCLGLCFLALENEHNERHKKEAELLAQKEQLRANLLRSISHDLRSPLTAISGDAENLLYNEEILSLEEKKKMYSDIYDDAMWLNNMVENLLAISKIKEGSMNLQMQVELIDEIVTEAMRHINRKKSEHHIHVDLSDEILTVNADARLMMQVVINLVNNAIKYTQKGSTIVVSTGRSEDQIYLQVQDNGPGISAEMREKVFETFYSMKSGADSARGTGLGLAVCRSIVTVHSGQITLRENPGGGCIFTVYLPAAQLPA